VVLASAPSTVTLVFSEPVTPAAAGIRVYGPTGREVAGAVSPRGAVLEAPVTASEAGTYVVLWQVYSADTHPSRGAFAFSVGGSSANPYAGLLSTPEAGTSTPLGLALQALARWVHFVGFALTFGVVAYGVLARRRERFGRLVLTGVGLLLVAEPLSLVAQLASLSFDADTALAVLGSGFGRILFLRLGAALVAWTLIATKRPWPVLATGGAIAVLDGLTAHAIPSVPGAGQALASVHVAAMGLWAGGLIAFLRAPDQRFGRYALITFGAAVVTGLALGLAHTRFGEELLGSDYGRVLLVKAAIVAAAGVAALIRRRRAEAVAVFAAIGGAAVVAALPPPA
jgi:copper transport protein